MCETCKNLTKKVNELEKKLGNLKGDIASEDDLTTIRNDIRALEDGVENTIELEPKDERALIDLWNAVRSLGAELPIMSPWE